MSGTSGSEEPSILCYNQGCGQHFKESENTATSCKFHPGTHFFHDAYKGWTCCRKSTDFTEFLNMKGCATSFHSNVKPPEVEKKKSELILDDVIEISQPAYVPIERPSVDAPMTELATTLSDSLKKQTYEAFQNNGNVEPEPEVKVGVTQCVNKGCTMTFKGPESDAEICKYHPGVPIFHEGLKYWSCCQKKTTEFENFMKQIGCQAGTHLWIKPKDHSQEVGVKCRQDWHQDGSNVIIVVYGGGKKFDPSKSIIKASPVKLSVELCFPEEDGYYREEWILGGIIDPSVSSVFMTPMKIEIKMKKAEPVKWASLDIPREKSDTIRLKEEEEIKDVGVEPVDLSDL